MLRPRTPLAALVTTLAALVFPAAALAGERTLEFRTHEDPAVANVPAGCPFANPNVRLGASAWSYRTRANDGQVVNTDAERIGTASLCGLISAPLIEGALVPVHLEATLGETTYTAGGECRVTSNNVPRPGLVLTGCALRAAPSADGAIGGIASSMSVFNAGRLPGFQTGSYWTLRLYTPDA